MKYITRNLEPLIIGFTVALLTVNIINIIVDIILKIAILKYK